MTALDALAALLKVALYGAVLIAASEGLPAPSRHLRSRFLGRRGLSVRRLRQVLLGAAATAALLSALVFATRLGAFDLETLLYLAGTTPVHGWGLILVGALLSAFVTQGVLARRLAAGLMLAGLAWSGHLAAASSWWRLVMLAHLAAASWWLGGLVSLANMPPRLAAGRLATIIADFSARAGLAVGLLIGAGGLAILLLARGHPLSESYLVGLAIKFGLVAAVLLLALYNKVVLTPALAQGGRARLRAAIRCELLLMIAILVATAGLTSFLAPHQGHYRGHSGTCLGTSRAADSTRLFAEVVPSRCNLAAADAQSPLWGHLDPLSNRLQQIPPIAAVFTPQISRVALANSFRSAGARLAPIRSPAAQGSPARSKIQTAMSGSSVWPWSLLLAQPSIAI